jgi:hypothetical protein
LEDSDPGMNLLKCRSDAESWSLKYLHLTSLDNHLPFHGSDQNWVFLNYTIGNMFCCGWLVIDEGGKTTSKLLGLLKKLMCIGLKKISLAAKPMMSIYILTAFWNGRIQQRLVHFNMKHRLFTGLMCLYHNIFAWLNDRCHSSIFWYLNVAHSDFWV